MNRRDAVLALLALGITPRTSFAQQAGKVRRIGFLAARSRSTTANPDVYYDSFVRGMRALGYIEGQNLAIEWRFANGHPERLPRFAAELAQLKVEVIVTHSILTTEAAQHATTTIPIVFCAMTDPVVAGVVKSLAKPEGNVTGLSLMSVDLSQKYVELLASIIPKLSRIAFLMTPLAPTHSPMLRDAQVAAKSIGATVRPFEASNLEEIERGFVAIAGWHAEALIVAIDPIYIGLRRQLVQLTLKNRIPALLGYPEDVEAGALLSYGPDAVDVYGRAAGYVDKIFKGAKIGDLPVEQPTAFTLVINLKTAKTLGIKFPQSILMRAERVIE